MKYDTLLFDADNTLLDFDTAEEQALKLAFEQTDLVYSHAVLDVYRKNNVMQWQLYERGLISRDTVLTSRFEKTFEELNLAADCRPTADLYEKYLHNGFFVIPNAEEILLRLQKQKCRLYLITNGVLSIQNSRMKGSGLDKYFLRRFVSEEIGYQKPRKEFFDFCFANIDNFNRASTLVIGDSLTSDVQGGINAGVDTCWYNPKGQANTLNLNFTYQISDLMQLLDIVK